MTDPREPQSRRPSEQGEQPLDESSPANPGSLIDHPTDGTDSEDRPDPATRTGTETETGT